MKTLSITFNFIQCYINYSIHTSLLNIYIIFILRYFYFETSHLNVGNCTPLLSCGRTYKECRNLTQHLTRRQVTAFQHTYKCKLDKRVTHLLHNNCKCWSVFIESINWVLRLAVFWMTQFEPRSEQTTRFPHWKFSRRQITPLLHLPSAALGSSPTTQTQTIPRWFIFAQLPSVSFPVPFYPVVSAFVYFILYCLHFHFFCIHFYKRSR